MSKTQPIITIYCSRDDTGHNDPLGERSVLPVRHHHPGLPSLRHGTKVEVEEGLALKKNRGCHFGLESCPSSFEAEYITTANFVIDMKAILIAFKVIMLSHYLVSPLCDLHDLISLRIVAELSLREYQLPIDLHFESVCKWKILRIFF